MPRPISPRFLGIACFCLLLVAIAGLAGCSKGKSSASGNSSPAADSIAPEELLTKLRSTYAELASYSDNALLLQRGVSRSRGAVTEVPFTRLSVLFERPNRYAITYDHGIALTEGRTSYRVVSDGERIRSTANELPDQIHEAIAPRQATLENLIPEPELRQAILNVSLENLFPQLAMLLATDTDKPVFPRASRLSMLPEESIGEVACYRLMLAEPEGERVLWIDKEKLILRRMEIPIEGQRQMMDPAEQFSSFSVDLDFDDVALDPEIEDATVTVPVPEKARLVRRFVPPPPPAPSADLGKPIKDFSFTDMKGNKVTPNSLAGKVCVLDFWSTDCAPCKEGTPHLEKAYQELKSSDDVAFYGVSTDPKGLPTEAVEKTLQSWGATFPLLRDLDKNSYYNLDVQATPTLMLVSADGKLQATRVGILESSEELIKKVQQIQAGEELPELARKEHAQRLDQYLAILAAATIPDSLLTKSTSPVEIAPRKLPEHLQLEQLWQTKLAEVGSPGAVALLQDLQGNLQEVVVLDGGEAIVRFDPKGKKIARIELPRHEEKDGGFLRTAVDAEGTHWVLVSGVGWQRVYLYNNDWKLEFSFPDEDHSGIGDVQLLDLKESGSPDLFVGYWGGWGVQAGSLTGERLWINRHLDHVLQIAAGPTDESGDQSLWCTSTRGTVLELTAGGKVNKEIVVAGHTMVSVEAPLSGSTDRCGVSLIEPGKYAVMSFDENDHEVWRYDLPSGEYAQPIPTIPRIDLPDHERCRVMTGPDGSMHFLSPTGELIDRFDYGKQITGLATLSTAESAILWVSAGDRLTAWRIQGESAP